MKHANKQRALYILSDYIMSAIALCLFNCFRYILLFHNREVYGSVRHFLEQPKIISEIFGLPIILLFIYWLSGYYNNPFLKSRLQELITTLCSAFINTVIIFLVLMTNDMVAMRSVNFTLILLLFGSLFLLSYLGRSIITSISTSRFKKRKMSFRTLIIGNSLKARETAGKLLNSTTVNGYEILGFVDIPGEKSSGMPAIPLSDLENVIRSENISIVIISPEEIKENQLLRILSRLYSQPVSVKIAPGTFSYLTYGIHLNDIYGEPFVELTNPNTSESTKNLKRVLDIAAASAAIIILSPLYAAIALSVKLTSPGPVIYSQERIGYRQRPFKIYKFRSMHTDAENNGPQLATDNDSRITPIGHILRKYRLDELPQFWNVIKGDMAIVGPRPEREYYEKQIVERAPYYTLLHQVRPGITSWGMVKYGYASSISQMVERTQYDLIYLMNMSLSVDLKIMVHTVKTVITGRGK